ncbi:MAG: hypothetical protein MJ192_04405 [Clostridia bacterium]|nr:hypothetical protein [Clostridia bacterium]
MKKLLVILLSAIMVLSMIPAMALTASAAGEGIWTTRRNIGDDDPDSWTPAGGYVYTSEGFQTISPDFTNLGAYYTIETKEAQNLKDGFSMKFRVDEFGYKGPEGDADEWITLSIWESATVTPGSSDYGAGWLTLIRGTGEGTATSQSFWTDAANPETGAKGGFNHKGDVAANPELDDEGKEIYTLTVDYSGGYSIKVNGVEIAGNADVSAKLEETKPDGDYFIGITFHTGAVDLPASLTILETNGSVPTGSDKKDPDPNNNIPGERIMPDTIAANTPVAVLDATLSSSTKMPSCQNCTITPKGDNTFRVESSIGSAFFFQWGIKASINHYGEDFPVVAMLLRNYYGNDGQIYYCAGKVVSPGDTNHEGWMIDYDYEWEIEDDIYDLVISDFTDYENFVGQIHSFRYDFAGISADAEDGFDICYVATFKTVEDAVNYTMAYVNSQGEIKTDAPTEPKTAAPTEPATEPAATEPTTGEADTTNGTGEADTTAADEGCKSVIGGCAALILTAVAAAVALKKKH